MDRARRRLPRRGESDPAPRLRLRPRRDVTIEDTWDSSVSGRPAAAASPSTTLSSTPDHCCLVHRRPVARRPCGACPSSVSSFRCWRVSRSASREAPSTRSPARPGTVAPACAAATSAGDPLAMADLAAADSGLEGARAALLDTGPRGPRPGLPKTSLARRSCSPASTSPTCTPRETAVKVTRSPIGSAAAPRRTPTAAAGCARRRRGRPPSTTSSPTGTAWRSGGCSPAGTSATRRSSRSSRPPFLPGKECPDLNAPDTASEPAGSRGRLASQEDDRAMKPCRGRSNGPSHDPNSRRTSPGHDSSAPPAAPRPLPIADAPDCSYSSKELVDGR